MVQKQAVDGRGSQIQIFYTIVGPRRQKVVSTTRRLEDNIMPADDQGIDVHLSGACHGKSSELLPQLHPKSHSNKRARDAPSNDSGAKETRSGHVERCGFQHYNLEREEEERFQSSGGTYNGLMSLFPLALCIYPTGPSQSLRGSESTFHPNGCRSS